MTTIDDANFYDAIAGEYDEITGRAGRSAAVVTFCAEFAGRFGVRSAVDAACGTGVYALELARLGVETVGADLSARMLEQARMRADTAGLAVRWILTPMQALADRLDGPRDALLCMGNSLPHLLTDDELRAAMNSFAAAVRPGGVLAAQVLNYPKILAEQERIVGINRAGGREYVRFYDFLPGRVRFNVLEIGWDADPPSRKLTSTTLRPYTPEELATAMKRQGFGEASLYGDLRFGPFDREKSDTVLIVARR